MSSNYISKALEFILKLNNVCVELSCECAKVLKSGGMSEEEAAKRFSGVCGTAIARRADDAPQLLYSIGLVPTLTLFMSKVDCWLTTILLTEYLIDSSATAEKLIEWVSKYSEAETESKASRHNLSKDSALRERNRIYASVMRTLCSEFTARSSAGYSAILSVILAYLHSLGELNGDVVISIKDVVERIENKKQVAQQTVFGFAANLANYLLDLHKSREATVTHRVAPFLLEFKKLARSILEKER